MGVERAMAKGPTLNAPKFLSVQDSTNKRGQLEVKRELPAEHIQAAAEQLPPHSP